MNPFTHVTSVEWCEPLVWTLLHSVWQVIVCGAAVWVALRIARTAQVRSAACAAGLMVMAISSPITYGVMRSASAAGEQAAADPEVAAVTEFRRRATAASSAPSTADGDTVASTSRVLDPSGAPTAATAAADPPPDSRGSPSSAAGGPSAASAQATVMGVTALSYLLGVGFFGLRLLWGVRYGWRLRRLARGRLDNRLSARAAALAAQLGGRIRPGVAYCSAVSVPVVTGIVRPMILLPGSLATGLSSDELESVLLHEVIHLCRRDQFVLAAQRLVETLLFFHPVMWWVSRRLSAERELACDDAVLAAGAPPVCYAESLLKVAQFGSVAQVRPQLLAASGRGAGQLRRRVVRILRRTGSPDKVFPQELPAPSSSTFLSLNALQQLCGVVVLIAVATLLSADWNGLWGQRATESEVTAPADNDNDVNADAAAAHLLTVVRRGERAAGSDTLLLVTIANEANRENSKQTVASEQNLLIGFRAIGVYGGRLLAIKMHQLIAIDLRSGERRTLQRGVSDAALAGDRLFTLTPAFAEKPPLLQRTLRCIDLSTGTVRELLRVESPPRGFASMGDANCALAANLDGSRVALTAVVRAAVQPRDEHCQLVVVDAISGESVRARKELPLRFSGTGGGTHVLAPRLLWTDNQTVIAAAPVSGEENSGEITRRAPPMQLTRFDATTMQSEVVCQLPEFVGKMHEPRLSRRGDASIFVQVGRQGQYRVDLAGKRLVKDNRVGAGYELRSSAKSTSLWRGDQELSPRTAVDRVFAAPDGKQVAWLPHDVGASNIIRRGPVDLRMHDSVRGVRTVMREWFARRGQTARDGSINLCLWLSDRDLKRKGAFDRFPVTEKRGPPAPLENEGGKDQAAEVEELKVEELIEQLSSSDGGVRGRAAYQLGELGAEAAPAIPHLINQFGDLLAPVVDPEHDHGTQISVVAMNSLASIGEPAVQPLIDAMLDKEVRQDRRACCAQTLGMLKDPRSYDALIQAVADEHQGLRLQAGMALRRIGDPVFDKLAAVIDDENPHVRLGATRGLQSIKSARATGLLIARLGDEDHQVRYAAAGALGSRNGEKAVVDALLLATNDSHKETRAEVYGALCYCRDPRLLKLLIAGLNDSNPVVQWRSAEGLGSLKSPTAVDPLLTALKSADESLRSNAARSLGAIGDKRALNALIEIARTDPEEDVRVTAGRAIGELEHPQASRGEVAWGKAVDGVQLGLSCETGLRPYRVGEVVRFERLIRNRSDRPWRFKVEIGPRINPHTAGGVTTLHSGESSDGPINVRSVTVDPGQDGWLDTVDFKIQSPGSSQRSQLSALQLPAGEHTITTRLDRTGFGPAQQPGVWMRALTAGQVEFVIRDGGAAGATKDAPRPESQSVLGRVKQLVESPNKTTAERLESTRAQLKMATAGLGEQQRQSIRNAFVMSAVGYLDSANRRARCDAGVVLVGLDDERGLASIIKELQDKKPRPTKMSRSDGRPHVDGQIASDRYYAALLLGQLGDNRAVPALIEATKDETINYRAAISLGEIGDKRAIPALRAMATAVPDQQLWAGYGLAALGEQQGFDLLSTAALTDPKWTDRRHAVEALGGVGDRRAVPTVVKVLQTDKHENVRVSAARALGEIGDPAALPALRAALNDKVVTKVNAPTTVAKEARSAIAAIEAGDDNAASRAGEDDVRVVVDRFIRAVSNQDTDAIARDAVSPWIDREEIRDDPIADIFSGIQLSASFRTSPKRIAVVESLKEVERIRGEAFPADVRQRWFEVVTDDHRIALIGGGKLVTAWAVRRNSGRAKVCGLLFAYYPSDEDALAKVLPPRASAAGQDGDEPKPRDRRQSTNRVVDAQGKPIVGATVEVLPYTVSEKPPLGSTKTDQQGRFEYPLETPEKKVFYIRISADGFVSERWIGNHRVHIRKNGQLEPDEFRLDRAATLRGRVIGADGEGLANIPLAFDYFNDRVASVNNRRFKSDTDGRFELTDLPAGELFVRYDPYKGQVKYRDAVFFVAHRTVRDGQTVENVVLDLSQCRCEIAGRVVDEQGKGRGNITVRAAFAFSARRLDHAVSAKTDDAGRFEFKNLPPHAFELSARTRGGGLGKRVIVQLRQGEQTKLTMHAYIPGHAPPADREVALNWGPERENLEAALFVEPSRPFERGDSMDVRIAVRNVGDAPRVFRDTLSFNRLHIFGPHGHETRDFRAFTGRPWSESYRLEPGHEVVLKGSFNLRWMGPDDTGPKNSMFRINHYAQKTYQLQVSFGDGFDSKRRPPAGNSRWMTDKLQIRTK